MAEDKKPISEEEMKFRLRNLAMNNVQNSKLTNTAIAYFVDDDKNFGEYDNAAVHDSLYLPNYKDASFYDFKTGKEVNIFDSILQSSRQPKKRYSGLVRESDVVNTAANILQDSLRLLKVEDILKLMNSARAVDSKYSGKYVSDITPKITQAEFDKLPDEKKKEVIEGQKLSEGIIESYTKYMAFRGVASAMDDNARGIQLGLEDILCVPEKKEDNSIGFKGRR